MGVMRSFSSPGIRIFIPTGFGVATSFSFESSECVNALISFSNRSQAPGSLASGMLRVAPLLVVGVVEGVEGVGGLLAPFPLSMLGAL
jgi:hypothetical protein